MDLLYYFAPPLLFILLCMSLARWLGAKREALSWMVRGAGRWLTTWSVIGFAMAIAIGILAWATDASEVMNHASLVWPFCLGLMSLEENSNAVAILLVFSITALQNAVLYLVLATLVWGSSNWILRIWLPREEPPSILGQ